MERRSRRSEVKLEATGCSRRWTTLEVEWNKDTLSVEHRKTGIEREWREKELKLDLDGERRLRSGDIAR